MDIFSLTIETVLEGYRTKKFTAVDVIKACLENVKKYNTAYNVLLTVRDEDELLEEAKNVDYSKPLAGIPVVHKDLFSTENIRTTGGAKIIDNYVPPYDATVVRKIKEAGAIIIGKANEDAWGHGSSGENSDFGLTRNPWDHDRVPGGSSSGSAVALAMGMCLMSTGTDTGSSVRLPAAFCNLVGIKPTYGRVSRYGIIAMASSFDTIGHLTRTVFDNALVLEITAGKDRYDGTTGQYPVAKYTHKLSGTPKSITVGIPKEYLMKGIDKKIGESFDETLRMLTNLGFQVKEISLPHTKDAMACYYILVPSEVSSNLARYDGVRYGNSRQSLGSEAKRRIMTGAYALSAGYYDAYYRSGAKVRTLIKQDFNDAFGEVDVIVAPSSPSLPFKIGEKADDPLKMYLSDIFMCPVNLAGVPSLNVPAGFVDGLPVGIQFIGPQWSEGKLYEIGQVYEQATKWYEQKPKL